MYPSSKSKSSFRIADILHQQQQQQQQTDSQLLAHHLMLKNSVHSSELNKNPANMKSHPTEMSSRNEKTPSPDTTPDISPDHALTKADAPMKPTPMYSNFPMPFPLGIHPAFHPAAAYLNYADAIHKGEKGNMSSKFWVAVGEVKLGSWLSLLNRMRIDWMNFDSIKIIWLKFGLLKISQSKAMPSLV